MKILKQLNGIQLNQGNSMANGLFNLSCEENDKINVSFWFDEEVKDRLLNLKDAEFYHQAKDMIKESNL